MTRLVLIVATAALGCVVAVRRTDVDETYEIRAGRGLGDT